MYINYDLLFLSKNKIVDYNHIETVEILVDGVFMRKSRQIRKISKGDIITVQYLKQNVIEVKLNDEIIDNYDGLAHKYKNITWQHIYWRSDNKWNKKLFYNYIEQIERNNKLKSLLIC